VRLKRAPILKLALTYSSKAEQGSSSEDIFKSAVILAGMLAVVGKVITSRTRMAPAQGLEPRRAVLETAMLPLHHVGVPPPPYPPPHAGEGREGGRWWRPLVTIQARGRYERPPCTSALPPHRGHDSNVRRTRVRTSASKAGRLGLLPHPGMLRRPLPATIRLCSGENLSLLTNVEKGGEMERAAGIDPASPVWKTGAHPSIPDPLGGELRARFPCLSAPSG
jgi:hypothetical protein